MRKRLAKLFLIVSLAWMATGCAVSGTTIMAYAVGAAIVADKAVTVAGDAKKVAKTIEEIKDIRDGENKAPCED